MNEVYVLFIETVWHEKEIHSIYANMESAKKVERMINDEMKTLIENSPYHDLVSSVIDIDLTDEQEMERLTYNRLNKNCLNFGETKIQKYNLHS